MAPVTANYKMRIDHLEVDPCVHIADKEAALGVQEVYFEYRKVGEPDIYETLPNGTKDWPVYGTVEVLENQSLDPDTLYEVRTVVKTENSGVLKGAWFEFNSSDTTKRSYLILLIRSTTAVDPLGMLFPPIEGATITIPNPDGPDWVKTSDCEGFIIITAMPVASYAGATLSNIDDFVNPGAFTIHVRENPLVYGIPVIELDLAPTPTP